MAKKLYFQYQLVGKNNRILKDADNFEKASKFNLLYGDEVVLKNEPFPKRLKSSTAKSNYIFKSKETIKNYIKQLQKELDKQILEEAKKTKEKAPKEKIKKEKTPKEKIKKEKIIPIEDKEITPEIKISKPKKEKIKKEKDDDFEFERELEEEFEKELLKEHDSWIDDGVVYFKWDKVSVNEFVEIINTSYNIDDESLFRFYSKNFSEIKLSLNIFSERKEYVKPNSFFKNYSNITVLNDIFIPFKREFLLRDFYTKTSRFIIDYFDTYAKEAFEELKSSFSFSSKDEINLSAYFPFYTLDEENNIVNMSELTRGFENLYENAVSLSYLETVNYFDKNINKTMPKYIEQIPSIIKNDNYVNNSFFEAVGYYFTGLNFHISHRE